MADEFDSVADRKSFTGGRNAAFLIYSHFLKTRSK